MRTKKYCSCGFPQSHPIPHEHDQTDREKAIIKHYRESFDEVVKALEEIVSHELERKRVGMGYNAWIHDSAKQALAKVKSS